MIPEKRMQPVSTDALLVIDVQRDFCPGGPLAVADGDAIIPTVNDLGRRFEHVILTQDWHPASHISFASTHPGAKPYTVLDAPYGSQTLWPDHCVQGSTGAQLHKELDLPHAELLLRKGFRREIDSYSAFLENDHTTATGLAGYLRERNLRRLFICGLAYDFCVRYTAIDGSALGFECLVIEDATRAVNLGESVADAQAAFHSASVARLSAHQIL